MSDIMFRHAATSDAARCYEIETMSYEGDEAATLEKIVKRIAEYPEGFLVLEIDGQVVGFINSGCAHDVVMSDEEFKELVGHEPSAPNVVILSVVVHPAFQGKGYSKLLMNHFIAGMKALQKETIHLMCKEQHISLYENMGFRYIKPSDSGHGGMIWHEMVMEF